VLDAEVAAPNTIRVDTQNVLALTLSPGAALIDPAKDVKVIWNGEARTVRSEGGRLKLRARSIAKGRSRRTRRWPGRWVTSSILPSPSLWARLHPIRP